MHYPPREWLFDDKLIYSVHDLRDEPWASACDIHTVDWIETTKLASSDDPQERRLFVWMLNECLRSFAGKIGMRGGPGRESRSTGVHVGRKDASARLETACWFPSQTVSSTCALG
jgi:hypothetical protein